jgi:hypothetical protein
MERKMKAEYHLFVSTALASVFYVLTGSLWGSIFAFCAGFWIDLDHFFDFWLYKRKLTLTREFFTNYYHKSGKIYVPLHSIELLWLAYLIQVLSGSVVILGICVGMTVHMVMDLFGNRTLHPLAYFLSFRILNNFRAKHIAKDFGLQN